MKSIQPFSCLALLFAILLIAPSAVWSAPLTFSGFDEAFGPGVINHENELVFRFDTGLPTEAVGNGTVIVSVLGDLATPDAWFTLEATNGVDSFFFQNPGGAILNSNTGDDLFNFVDDLGRAPQTSGPSPPTTGTAFIPLADLNALLAGENGYLEFIFRFSEAVDEFSTVVPNPFDNSYLQMTFNFDYAPASVPEPSAFFLGGFALMGMAFFAHRRRRRAAALAEAAADTAT